ncbi:hypothetical protein MC885_016242, partial [Smutsia gigantea]
LFTRRNLFAMRAKAETKKKKDEAAFQVNR